MKKPERRVYTIHCPVQEIWEIEVVASSEEDAMRRYNEGQGHQTCSFAGTTKSGQAEIIRSRPVDEND